MTSKSISSKLTSKSTITSKSISSKNSAFFPNKPLLYKQIRWTVEKKCMYRTKEDIEKMVLQKYREQGGKFTCLDCPNDEWIDKWKHVKLRRNIYYNNKK